jgi:hypothetical protein
VGGLKNQLAQIPGLTRAELDDRWATLTGRPVPRVSPRMLRLALGYEMQAKAMGGLTRTALRQLDETAAARRCATPLAPGMRLVREWHGATHVVTVDESGAIHWNDRTWRSLSEIARAITGTRWSGPAFFGLVKRSAA